ncbi:MAG: VCBS repeat-containing protein [Lentisphaerota bacterium]
MNITSNYSCKASSLCAVMSMIFPFLASAVDPGPDVTLNLRDGNLYMATSCTNQFILERKTASTDWEKVGLFTGAASGEGEWFRTVSLQGTPEAEDDAIVFTPGDLGEESPAGDGQQTLIRQGVAGDDGQYGPLVRKVSPASMPAVGGDVPLDISYTMVYWHSTNGETAYWGLNTNGVRVVNGTVNTALVDKVWMLGGFADINNDGRSEVIWCPSNATMKTWFLDSNYAYASQSVLYGSLCPKEYQMRCVGDCSGDGYNDLFFQDTYFGYIDTWHVNLDGTLRIAYPTFASSINRSWQLRCCGDVSGDGRVELFFHNTNSGQTGIWFLDTNGQLTVNSLITTTRVPTGWVMRASGDVSGDGRSEIFWQHTNGNTSVWFMNTNGVKTVSRQISSTLVPKGWLLRSAVDVNGDGRVELLWHNTTSGATSIWFLNTSGVKTVSRSMNNVAVATKWKLYGPKDGMFIP